MKYRLLFLLLAAAMLILAALVCGSRRILAANGPSPHAVAVLAADLQALDVFEQVKRGALSRASAGAQRSTPIVTQESGCGWPRQSSPSIVS